MNIFLFELKAYRKSTIIWMISLGLICAFLMSIYPAYTSNKEAMLKILDTYPPEVLKAFSINLDYFFSLLGFYAFVFAYIILTGAIQGMNVGLSIISKENRFKTADFLLTKPVKRTKVLTAKICAALTVLVATNVVYLGVAYFIAELVKKGNYDVKTYLLISLTNLFVQVIFAAIGILLGVCMKKVKSVVPVSLAVVFGFYIVGMLGAIIGDKAVTYLTPFMYFNPTYIIDHGAYDMKYVLISVGVVFVAILSSYIIYSKKDVPSV